MRGAGIVGVAGYAGWLISDFEFTAMGAVNFVICLINLGVDTSPRAERESGCSIDDCAAAVRLFRAKTYWRQT